MDFIYSLLVRLSAKVRIFVINNLMCFICDLICCIYLFIYRIPRGEWIFVCCECRVLSGKSLYEELITRPEESYRLCCVVVCDLETSRIGAPYIYDISNLRVNRLGAVQNAPRLLWRNYLASNITGYHPAMGQVSLPVLRFYPVGINPPIPTHIIILYHYLKDMRTKSGNLQIDAPSHIERVLWRSEFDFFAGIA
jgi:hypothetical protein